MDVGICPDRHELSGEYHCSDVRDRKAPGAPGDLEALVSPLDARLREATYRF